MGIRDRLTAHDSRFVSVSELLTAIARAENVTQQEVARALYLDGILSAVQTYLRLHDDENFIKGGEAAVDYELECAEHGGSALLSADAESDLYNGDPGFFREEIVLALNTAGWNVPSCLTEPVTTAETIAKGSGCISENTRDLHLFIPRLTITLGEAADLLAEENGGDWWPALKDAADSNQIQAGIWSVDRGEQPLSHTELRAWCEAAGAVWPVPLPPGSSTTTDEGLREALAASRAECDTLREELARLKAAARSNDSGAHLQIKGATFEQLVDIVINKFPNQYPDRSKVKLDNDVRPWMKDELNLPDRERHIFGKIIAEHFGLKD